MKFTFITLGCPKNEVDTEYYIKKLSKMGHSFVEEPESADYIFLNTCAFIKDAISESMETYRRLVATYGEDKVILTGCMVERLKHKLSNTRFIRGDDIVHINKLINNTYVPDFSKKQHFIYNGERFYKDNLPYAYIKIQEGCSRRCTFCTIPSIRGKPRFRNIEEIKREALELSKNGKIEIILVGEDLTLYKDLIPLLDTLIKIDSIKLIRLMYLHPQGIKRELLEFIRENPKIARYLHIPIQHASERVLKLMGRSGGERAVKKAIENVRKIIPGAFIRTEIMVGFPEEQESDFNVLLNFLEDAHIERLGIFKYSQEEGTKSFSLNQVDEDVKEERFQRAHLLASILMEEAQKRLHKKRVRIIADTPRIGRTEFDTPTSDLIVRFKKPLLSGKIYRKKLLYSEESGLIIAS